MARLYLRCRATAFGSIILPSAGGMLDQSAWLMSAFEVLAAEELELPKEK